MKHLVTHHSTARHSHFATCKCGWRSSINIDRAIIEGEVTRHRETA